METTATNLSELLPSYISVRNERLELERKARELEAKEQTLKYDIERAYKLGRLEVPDTISFEIKYKQVPFVEDWDEFLTWVEDTGNIEVFQKRITESVLRELLKTAPIPGATTVEKPVITASWRTE